MYPFLWLGAYHASGILMNFSTYDLLTSIGNTTDFEVRVSSSMQEHMLSFAKDPRDGPKILGWQPMYGSSSPDGKILRFDADSKPVQQIDSNDVGEPCRGVGRYEPYL